MTERTRACSSAMKAFTLSGVTRVIAPLGRVEPSVALQEVQVQTITVGDVGLADGGKMASRPAALEPLRRPARFRPAQGDRLPAIRRRAAIAACPTRRHAGHGAGCR